MMNSPYISIVVPVYNSENTLERLCSRVKASWESSGNTSTGSAAIHTKTNHSGGTQGGISNGMDIYFRVAFKPVATIAQEQQTIDKDGNTITLSAKGRHDPCVVPRAVPIVEAMAALVLANHYLRNKIARL